MRTAICGLAELRLVTTISCKQKVCRLGRDVAVAAGNGISGSHVTAILRAKKVEAEACLNVVDVFLLVLRKQTVN
jgi:hypothetical protein